MTSCVTLIESHSDTPCSCAIEYPAEVCCRMDYRLKLRGNKTLNLANRWLASLRSLTYRLARDNASSRYRCRCQIDAGLTTKLVWPSTAASHSS
jgi:hypothetical protein